MNTQSFLLECLKKSLEILPKVIYLNNILEKITLTAKVHMDIILSYFFQCHNCKNFFNDEDIVKCNCTEWCKFCARMNVNSSRCSKCRDRTIAEMYQNSVLKCIFLDCKNNANFGSMTQALYCTQHVSASIIINYYHVCDIYSCNRTAIYYGNGLRCEEHKTEKSLIFFREGPNYISVNKKSCDVCGQLQTILYKCDHCYLNRCAKCAYFDMFTVEVFHKDVSIYCCNCIHKYRLIDRRGGIFDTAPQCDKCYDKGEYINGNNIYCTTHSDNEKIGDDVCGYADCYAYSKSDSLFCRFHYNFKG